MTTSPKALLNGLILTIVLAPPPALAKTPVATGTGGAVATISEKASTSAMAILNKGGNAIDAAVAAAATLGVTDPFSCGIGGGGFMVVYLAKDRRVVTIDHRETAPASFSPGVFMENGKPVDFDATVASGLSVGVPGTVRGWHEALERYGTMSFKQVLAPAIRVATRGFPVDENFHKLVTKNERKFQQFSTTSRLYLKDGKALPVGTILKNPDLAKAYREIAARGYKAFYAGPMAQAIVAAVNLPPVAGDGKNAPQVRGGTMTMTDLANYEVRIRQPVRSTYRGYDVYGMPLPSSGGLAIAEALNILEGYDLKSMPRPNVEHLYLEASRLAFADRNAYLADPEYVDAPVEGLLSKQFAAQRRSLIRPDRAASVVHAGDPFLYENDQSFLLRPQANLIMREGTHTTHLVVSDKQGNVVSYTFTLEDWGGSGIVVPGYGFILNNEMTDFDFVGPAPNIPEAGKRPRSSMSPTIVFRDGKPAFALGSPGGATIITTVLQTMVNYIDLGLPMDQAIDAPRLSQRNSKETEVEPGFGGSVQARALEAFGHQWAGNPAPEEIGAANAIVFNPDGTVTAVSEGRRHGSGAALVQKRAH